MLLKPPSGKKSFLQPLLRRLQQGLRQVHRRLRRLHRHPGPQGLPQRRAGAGVHRVRRLPGQGASPPASCPTRTTATSSPTSSSPTPPRWSGPTRWPSGSRRSSARPRGSSTSPRHRLLAHHRRLRLQHRLPLRLAQALGGAARPRRSTPSAHREALNAQLRKEVPEAMAVTFGPPPIPGLGSGSGFTMMLQDRSGGAPEFLADNAQKFLAAARKRPEIGFASTFFRASVPQIYADLDRDKVTKLGVPVTDVNATLGTPAGRHLRQRLQPVRPHLQGLHAGRAGVPRPSREEPRPLLRAHGNRATWCRSTPWCPPGPSPARSSPTASTCTGRPRSPAPPAPGYSSAQALKALEETAKAVAAAGASATLVQRLLPGEGGRGHGRRGLRLRHRAGLPHPGGPVRELVAAL